MQTISLQRSGGFTVTEFYDVLSVLFSGVFDLISTPLFGIPLYVIFICIAIVSGIFALLSNKKGDNEK